jgi:hypothetical protein
MQQWGDPGQLSRTIPIVTVAPHNRGPLFRSCLFHPAERWPTMRAQVLWSGQTVDLRQVNLP